MAEASATFRIKADASEARREMRETTADAERMKAASERAQGAANAATGGPGGGGGGPPPIDPKEAARNMADEFGRRAGVAIGKFLVGFMVNQGVGTAFALARTPGKDSRRIDQAESTVQGAIQWGTAGAMAAGPWGAAIGAVLGGLNSFILKEKEIQDALAKSRIDYNRERGEARVSSKVRQEESAFDWMLRHMNPEAQSAAIRRHETELTGSGRSGQEIFDKYMSQVEEVKRLEGILAAAGSDMSVGTSGIEAKLEIAKLHLEGFEKMLDRVASGALTDEDGKPLTIGGNKAGTKNWYEAGAFYAEYKYGQGDEERTGLMKSRLAAVNAIADPMREKELGVYLGELDRLMGLAGREAVTDSASSKGLGVGAQIGGMVNDKIVSKMDEMIKAMRTTNKDMVDLLRPYFQNGGLANALGITY